MIFSVILKSLGTWLKPTSREDYVLEAVHTISHYLGVAVCDRRSGINQQKADEIQAALDSITETREAYLILQAKREHIDKHRLRKL